MASIFSRIVAGEIPAYKVAEDQDHLAFLDINPVAMGHVLVIPKKETDYIFDIESESYLSLWAFAAKVAKGLKKAVPCKRIGISVIGLEVPHAHIHLVPMNAMADINFSKTKLNPTKEELDAICQSIRKSLE
jgi:histidine triad (HIT) family protein